MTSDPRRAQSWHLRAVADLPEQEGVEVPEEYGIRLLTKLPACSRAGRCQGKTTCVTCFQSRTDREVRRNPSDFIGCH